MRTIARSICVVVLALMVWVPTSPAVAKGPTDVHVSGPGVDAHLDGIGRGGDIDLFGALAQAALLYQHWDGSGLAPAPRLTADQLGPRLSSPGPSARQTGRSSTPTRSPRAAHGSSHRLAGRRLPVCREQLIKLGALAEPPAPPPTMATRWELPVY